MGSNSSRREFAVAFGSTMAGILGIPNIMPRLCGAGHGIHTLNRGPHPDPRPGIDASRVIAEADVAAGYPYLVDLYNGIREIPEVADGIRCPCGCAETPDFRSLLVCYEENGMALWCEICQTVGRMTVRLNERGRSLDQIRAAIDARFG